MIRLLLMVIGSVIALGQVDAQKERNLTPYQEDYHFKKGIYLTVEDWKNNDPIPVDKIVTDLNPNTSKFFYYLFRDGSFKYIKDKRTVERVNTNNIFGYSNGKEVYYGTSARFNIIGAISLLEEIEIKDTFGSYINPGEQEYSVNRNEKSGKQYLFLFESGEKIKFKRKKFEKILKKRDPKLYESYRNDNSEKEEKVRKYLMRYNLNHPIYFPKS